MKTTIPLIAVVSALCGVLLLADNIEFASAFTLTVKSFGATVGATNEWNNCDYISSSEVWCPSSTGIKVWNPSTQSVIATLKSTGDFQDVKCTSSVCYGWEVNGVTGNLTRWLVSGKTLDDFQPFIGNTGFQTGHGIALVAGADEHTVILPVEGQTCVDGVTPLGNTDEKGVCLWNGGSGVLFNGERFITSQQTNDAHVIYDIEWNEGTGLFGNRALVKQRDAVGVFQWQLLNLADGDSTFSTNRICQTASLTGTIQQSKMVIINGIMYDTYDTSDMLIMNTALDTCTTAGKNNLVDELSIRTVTYSSGDDMFVVSATDTNGGNENSAVYLFNGTTFDQINTVWNKILKINVTDTTNPLWTHFNHPSEGEVHVWRGTQMVIIGELLEVEDDPDDPDTGGNAVDGRCGVGTVLDCIGDRSVGLAITGGQDITTVSGNLFCGIGFNTTCSGDIKENGTGILLMLITGVFFSGIVIASIATANTRFGAGISYTEIPKELWLFLVVSVVALAFYFQWIPDILFYGMVVGLAGLFAFGLYRHVRG
jgi:hypothetical protein